MKAQSTPQAVPVSFRRIGKAESHQGFSSDMTQRGMFIVSTHLVAVGTPIIIEIDLPSGSIQLDGVVAWTKWIPGPERGDSRMGFGVIIRTRRRRWGEILAAVS